MSIYVSQTQKSTFVNHPEGQFSAICIDVVDVGWRETTFGWKYKIRVVLFAGEYTEREIDGEKVRVPLTVQGMFTATLDERGRLLPFLTSWRGKAFTDDELEKFDVENLLGAPALLSVTWNKSGDRTYANITSISPIPPAMKGEAPDAPPEYVRVQDRDGWEGPSPHPDMGEPKAAEPEPAPEPASDPDDDLPF